MKNTESLRVKLQEKRESVSYLKELFESLFEFTPSDSQFMVWLNRFPVEVCSEAIERTAEWVLEHQQNLKEGKVITHKETGKEIPWVEKTETDILKYASGTMYYMQARVTGIPYVKRADRTAA